jgi:hypothetical protein
MTHEWNNKRLTLANHMWADYQARRGQANVWFWLNVVQSSLCIYLLFGMLHISQFFFTYTHLPLTHGTLADLGIDFGMDSKKKGKNYLKWTYAMDKVDICLDQLCQGNLIHYLISWMHLHVLLTIISITLSLSSAYALSYCYFVVVVWLCSWG